MVDKKRDTDNEEFKDLKSELRQQKEIIGHISSLRERFDSLNEEQKRMAYSRINHLKQQLKENNRRTFDSINKISLSTNLTGENQERRLKLDMPLENREIKSLKNPESKSQIKIKKEDIAFEKQIIKRIKKGSNELEKARVRKPNLFIKLSNKFFYENSIVLNQKRFFKNMREDIVKSNISLLPSSYISLLLFSTSIAIVLSIFLYIFLLFFSLSFTLPFFQLASGNFFNRMLTNLWVAIIPIGTFLLVFYYPSIERKSIGSSINQELPFVTIHMSAIAGSMIEPSEIFKIIVSTKEYPHTRKEFIRLINEINVYGYDLVSALRDCANKSPSKKLAELFRGLATTIVSGGSLIEFLDKRSETLLFDYRLEREKYTKTAETFMDIYISVVIAAPMIFMLLLIMMKISNLGLKLSSSAITIIITSVVSLINIVFLVFLDLKQPAE